MRGIVGVGTGRSRGRGIYKHKNIMWENNLFSMKGREEEFQLDEKGNILKDIYRIPHMVANVWKKKSNDKEVLLHSNK